MSMIHKATRTRGFAAVKHAVLWFRNDLRIHDNAIFHHPSVLNAERVTPVYIFDPRHYKMSPFGSRKTGKFRAEFMIESVNDLKDSLQKLGSDLNIFHAKPEDVLAKVAGPDSVVVCSEEVTSEELRVDDAVEKQLLAAKSRLVKVWGSTLYHPDDLPFSMDRLPEPFTAMRNTIERKSKVEVRELYPTPRLPKQQGDAEEAKAIASSALKSTPSLQALGFAEHEIELKADSRGVLPFKGGEQAALARLEHFTNTALKTYKNTRNGLIGADYSSKYSPWLANGCVSPRMIYWKTREYEDSHGGQTVHTYWLIFELMWRDFFRFYCAKHGNGVFKLEGPKNQRRQWSRDSKLIEAWKNGRTGIPWVDANMRELQATGFMSNRGRQNVASYLVHDLKVDWRYGADHFESLLLDHDVCSNYGNWVAAAGLTGGRINRFNMSKQASDYDKQGRYVKLWCPELKGIPEKAVHSPWRLTTADQQHVNCVIGQDYPCPVVTPKKYDNGGGGGSNSRSAGRNKKAKNFRGKGRVHRGRQQDFYTS
mmetsp:Transcript_35048/g.68206  ORF Transcript_35048/g.68206 Transcript_35048/m.68206 type:complete len:537 (-) Transcript_35048:217-1827(-)